MLIKLLIYFHMASIALIPVTTKSILQRTELRLCSFNFNQMKKIFLASISFVATITLHAQSKVVIRGYSEINELKSIGISPPLRDCIKGWVHIDDIPVDSTSHHFEKAVTITKPTLIYLHCVDYVEAFVEPGDTIDIYVKRLAKPTVMFDGHFKYQINCQASVKGNNSYNNFYSFLEEQTGKMNNVPYLISEEPSDDDKRVLIKKLYDRRINMLKDFITKNPGVSKQFINTANSEIEGQYFSKLIFSLHQDEVLSPQYLQDIGKEAFDWDKTSVSQYLMQAAYDWFTYYMDNVSGENYSAKRLSNKYNNINAHIKDIQLKNYFLTYLMVYLLEKDLENYQEIFEDYTQTCTNKDYVDGVAKLYRDHIPKEPITISHLTDSALAIFISDASGKSLPLLSVLSRYKNDVILLDFWASWCGPCIMQMPYLKELEKKYQKRVVFISLSVDHSKNAWIAGMQKNQLLGNQYLIENAQFGGPLKKDLKIKSIPRFVLMNGKGDVLNSDLPKPNETERIGKIIDKALLKNNSDN